MTIKQRRHRNLFINLLLFSVFEVLLFYLLQYKYYIQLNHFLIFSSVNVLYNGIIFITLLKFDRLFYYDKTNEEMSYINLATLLTILRLSSLISLMYLVYLASQYSLTRLTVVITAAIFLTDLLDGQIARRTNTITKIGKFLDSTADYFVILAISILMLYFRIIPVYIFILTLVRGFSQFPNLFRYKIEEGKIIFETSFLGKLSVFMVMFLYGSELFILTDLGKVLEPYIYILEITTAFILLMGSADKLIMFLLGIKKKKQDGV
ncbi:CDP-alcohol phosphatidyltransferase family protein [Spirochaeta cellobiosiphila]|uniref:CDP-alcohol phosphatidyltransferase family protein n=1 Tax=Spirochaeta cellobiosiphila TaxID=504483 RepID=UPI00040E7848|nr:CDP-alcohol phosphatidyltransferase family protein [Spirochaeta cellobiosiphila]